MTAIYSAGVVTFVGHVWPANSADAGYKLGGRVAQRQGFYFYRNDRLIQAGGWNGWRDDAEPHSSLARVKVDLSPRFDDAFAISVQKSSLDAPPGFLETVEAARAGHTTLADYIRDAIDLYRDAGAVDKHERPIVTKGLRAGLRKQLQTALTGGSATTPVAGVDILWSAELDPDEAFRVERDERVIWLNDRFRNMLLDGRSASVGDVPVFKTLVFLLLGDDALKARASKKVAEWHSTLNKCLVAALEDDR